MHTQIALNSIHTLEHFAYSDRFYCITASVVYV